MLRLMRLTYYACEACTSMRCADNRTAKHETLSQTHDSLKCTSRWRVTSKRRPSLRLVHIAAVGGSVRILRLLRVVGRCLTVGLGLTVGVWSWLTVGVWSWLTVGVWSWLTVGVWSWLTVGVWSWLTVGVWSWLTVGVWSWIPVGRRLAVGGSFSVGLPRARTRDHDNGWRSSLRCEAEDEQPGEDADEKGDGNVGAGVVAP
jgi:hypothetical protein